MKPLSTLLVIVALIAGTVSCGPAPTPTLTRYDLTTDVAPSGAGTTTDLTSTSPYAAGTSVSIRATADSGYQFVNWTAPAGTFADASAAQTTFTMPAQNVTATANFVSGYGFIIVANPALGGQAIDLTHASPYTAGTVVNITAIAHYFYHFVDWTAPAGTFADASAPQTTFTMPDQNVVVTANFGIGYFRTDALLVLRGPATLPPEQRNPCLGLEIKTDTVMDSVRVDLPDGRSVIVPRHTDVYSPGVDWRTMFRFFTCVPEMPTAGGQYVFTALDATGQPITGARNTDIWVGVEPLDPPTNVRTELTKDGILVSWDESPMVPGSFEPAAGLGFYQLAIHRIGTWELVYGACCISGSPHVIPTDREHFILGKDFGLSLSEMEDGTYCLQAAVQNIAPGNSLGKGCECLSSDPGQDITFTIQDGEITTE